MLKRSPSLVEQVKNHLKQRIVNAEFDDDRIPSETELAGSLNVSRNTIRDALGRLEMEGVIYRRQGAGTFVNTATRLVKTRLETIVPYEELIKEHGFKPAVRLISVKETPVALSISRLLDQPPETDILEVQKLFLADDQPVIFTHSYIPTSLIQQPYTPDIFLEPTLEFLPNYCQQSLTYFLTDIVPIIAPAWLTSQLALPASPAAIITFEEMGYNQEQQPIIKAISYFRDDVLRLRLVRLSG